MVHTCRLLTHRVTGQGRCPSIPICLAHGRLGNTRPLRWGGGQVCGTGGHPWTDLSDLFDRGCSGCRAYDRPNYRRLNADAGVEPRDYVIYISRAREEMRKNAALHSYLLPNLPFNL